jgi:hypothetical protein
MTVDRNRLHEIAVEHFGEIDVAEQFMVEHSEPNNDNPAHTYFLRHNAERRAYRFYFAVEPGVAAKRELGGEIERVSLSKAISQDIKINRNFGGNPTEPVITKDYAVYAFGNTKSILPIPASRN